MSDSNSKIVEFRSPAGDLLRQVAQTDQADPWFVAKDVCGALGIVKSRNAVASLDADQKGALTVGTLGGPQEMTVVSEAGLSALLARSSKPEAKAWWRWVRHEVLPSIRRTGSYAVGGASSDSAQLTNALKQIAQVVGELQTIGEGVRIQFAPSLSCRQDVNPEESADALPG